MLQFVDDGTISYDVLHGFDFGNSKEELTYSDAAMDDPEILEMLNVLEGISH
jgi:hypothetical protein